MKTPLNWISLYTPLTSLLAKHNTTELAHEYSIHTAEIDGIESHFLDKVVIGKVISCEKHPESKKLSIVEVQIWKDKKTTILTGAPNISEATYVPVALVGAVLGGDFTIGDRMMAGMMSSGMICWADEIGLATESDGGIMVLENMWDENLLESMIGKSLFDLKLSFPGINGKTYEYTLRDTTFEIDNKFITNRPDLFGVYGNAREWHAVFDIPFTEYEIRTKDKAVSNLPIHIETDRCLAYNAIKMENISVGKSPFGISLMMERAGLTPKMDLVDSTNMILTEFGQPMHVFDADKISGTITVRLAKQWEKILALNGIEYELIPEDMVIADDNGPIALAGIIGGMNSAVTESTTNVIWESATFDATSVRLSSQRHGIRTDASTRYEKSLDPLLAWFATARINDYLAFLGKNIEITAEWGWIYSPKQVNQITLEVSYDFINQKAGIIISADIVHSILVRLGFSLTFSSDMMTIQVPSWRASKDISIQEDIAEEIIRIYGYDNIPMQSLGANTGINHKNQMKSVRDLSLDFWKHQNWNEVYNYSFTNSILDMQIWYENMDNAVGIKNAFNVEYTHMRRSLSVRLFDNVAKNCNIQKNLKFFEIGRVYTKDLVYSETITKLLKNTEEKPYGEVPMIAWVSTNDTIESLRKSLESYLIDTIGYIPPLHQDSGVSLPFLHPGISGEYREGESVFIRFGRIHPATALAFDISADTLYWEGDIWLILSRYMIRETRVAPISKFQSIPRELSFVMDEAIHAGPIALDIESFHPWITSVHLGSIYRDENKLWIGKKSVNFIFSLTSHEHTISDDEALTVQNGIIDTMSKKGCHIRSI